MRRLYALTLSLLALNAVGGEMMSSTDTVMWNGIRSSSVTLSWDWSWEWVPEEAASVRLSVVGARSKTVFDGTFARDGETSQTVNVGRLTPEREDVYLATLTFLDSEGASVATRSAELYALAGNVGKARVCTQASDHPDWRKVKGPVLVPYDATWSEDSAAAVEGTLTVAPDGKAVKSLPFARQSGMLAVTGYGETEVTLSFGPEGTGVLEASLFWSVPGLVLSFK